MTLSIVVYAPNKGLNFLISILTGRLLLVTKREEEREKERGREKGKSIKFGQHKTISIEVSSNTIHFDLIKPLDRKIRKRRLNSRNMKSKAFL